MNMPRDSAVRHVAIILATAALAAAVGNTTVFNLTTATPTAAATTSSPPYISYHLIFSASPSCTSIWTFHTPVPVIYTTNASASTSVSIVASTPGSTILETISESTGTDIIRLEPAPTVVLPQSAIDPVSLSSLRSSYSPPWGAACTIPAQSAYEPTPIYDDDQCEFLCFSNDVLIGILVGVIVGWFMLIFIVGLLQNYAHFRRLCLGMAAPRGLPRSWACLNCPLSCFLLIGSSRGFVARSHAEQDYLQLEWNATSSSTRFKRWLKWGFRSQYPPFLGQAPPRRKKGEPRLPPEPRLRNPRRGVHRPADTEREDPPPPYEAQGEAVALPDWTQATNEREENREMSQGGEQRETPSTRTD